MIIEAESGNNIILKNLLLPEPFMAARLGKNEFECIMSYLHTGNWNDNIKHSMKYEAGFFPPENWALRDFCEKVLKDLPTVDLLATWMNEEILTNKYCRNQIILSKLRSVEPYYHSNPWSQSLKGKNVLVIHPFENSIKLQYEKRSQLFNDPRILPEFNLITLKAVQSLAEAKPNFKTWFEAFEKMCSDISGINFDIALIGAGAYGFSLASFIKNLKKKVIHMGGATQILFGIKGKRWDNHEDISKLYNNHWVRPSLEETPPNHLIVEDGSYW